MKRGMEIYRDIKGFGGRYQVTSWGRIYDVSRRTFLVQHVHHKGYLRVDLREENGKLVHRKTHRLVAIAFIPNPHNKPQVNHIDGNKQNNSITNLEWVTDEENKEHQRNYVAEIENRDFGDVFGVADVPVLMAIFSQLNIKGITPWNDIHNDI